MKERRTERLAEQIRDEIAIIISRELKDPRIGFVTVTRVDLASDLAVARVHVSVFGTPQQEKDSMKGLTQASGFVRRAIGQRLRIRQTPAIEFTLDKGIEHSVRVAELLDEVAKAPHSKEDDESKPE